MSDRVGLIHLVISGISCRSNNWVRCLAFNGFDLGLSIHASIQSCVITVHLHEGARLLIENLELDVVAVRHWFIMCL